MVEGLLSTLHWQLRIRHFHKEVMDRANAYSEDLLILFKFPYIAFTTLHLVNFRIRMDLSTIQINKS
jgi:hypothetical protein